MINLIKSISKKEWYFWFIFVIALVIITSLSRIFAIFWAGSEYIWTGRVFFSPVDRFVYISYINQIKDGAFLLKDLYNTAGEMPAMFNIFWIFLGLLARVTGLSALWILEISRIILIPLLLFLLYLFFSLFFTDIFKRKLAFLLAIFGGGVGLWVYPLLQPFFINKLLVNSLPIDFTSSEGFIFLTSYYSSHFIFSTSLFILIFLLSLLFLENKKYIYGVYAGILGAILLNFHPFTFTVISFILISYQIFLFFKDKKQAIIFFKYLLLFAIFVLPSAIYHIYMMSTPWWQNQAWASNTEAPNLLFILIGYGFLGIFGVMSFINILRKKIELKHEAFIVIWFLAQIVFIFYPISIQRRFLEGYQIVLVILSVYTIMPLLEKRKWLKDSRVFMAIVFTLLFSLSFLIIFYFDFYNFYSYNKSMYLKKDNNIALEEIKYYVSEDALIISDIYNSNAIPGLALRRVFVGHGVETINFKEKYDILNLFMDTTDDVVRFNILNNYHIDYFFYDNSWNNEWNFNPEEKKYLQKIYQKGDYILYKVIK